MDAYAHPDSYAHSHPDSYAHSYADANGDADSRRNAYPYSYGHSHAYPDSHRHAYPNADPDRHAYAYAHIHAYSDPDAYCENRLRLPVGERDHAVRREFGHPHGERLVHAVRPSADLHVSGASAKRRMAIRHSPLGQYARLLGILGGDAFLPRPRDSRRVRRHRRLQPRHHHVAGPPHRDPHANANPYLHANANTYAYAYPDSHTNTDTYTYDDAYAYPDSHTRRYTRILPNFLLERDRRAYPIEQPRAGQRLRCVDVWEGHAARDGKPQLGLQQSHHNVGWRRSQWNAAEGYESRII